jgi:hypothetical protein
VFRRSCGELGYSFNGGKTLMAQCGGEPAMQPRPTLPIFTSETAALMGASERLALICCANLGWRAIRYIMSNRANGCPS